MKTRVIKPHLFEIGFKGFYHEHCEHYAEVIKAKNRTDALKKFCRKIGIKDAPSRLAKRLRSKHVTWDDGDWLMSLRYVKEVKFATCPHCNGSGVSNKGPL